MSFQEPFVCCLGTTTKIADGVERRFMNLLCRARLVFVDILMFTAFNVAAVI
jgi:hypothetical protein